MQPRACLLLALASVAGLLTACGSTPPVSSPPAGAGVALACWSVETDECEALFAGAVALLPAGHPPVVAGRVGGHGCDEPPCGLGIVARGGGEVWVEFADGGGLVQWRLAVDGAGAVTFGAPSADPTAAVDPESPRASGPVAPLELGHCGLYSPIDFDGSLWDPTGPVDADATEAIGDATGTVTLQAPNLAQFRAPSGFTVQLQRHVGRKSVLLCD